MCQQFWINWTAGLRWSQLQSIFTITIAATFYSHLRLNEKKLHTTALWMESIIKKVALRISKSPWLADSVNCGHNSLSLPLTKSALLASTVWPSWRWGWKSRDTSQHRVTVFNVWLRILMCSTKLGDLKDNRSRGWHYFKQGRETVTDFVASTATTAAIMLSMSLVTAKHLQLRQLSPPHNSRSSSLSVARRNELKSEQRTSTVLGSLSFVVFVRLFHCAFCILLKSSLSFWGQK